MRSLLLIFLVACGADPTNPPTEPEPLSTELSTCAPCNGPGCEELDEACRTVAPDSHGMMCPDGADPGPDAFVVSYRGGRVVTCGF